MPKHYYVIVLAEDDPGINSLLSELLREEGYTVHSCVSGAEALRLVSRVKPDLVIADVQMETKDAGLRLLAQIRASPLTSRIGVILCSADVLALSQRGATLAELDATVLSKPFDLEALTLVVRRLLTEQQEGR